MEIANIKLKYEGSILYRLAAERSGMRRKVFVALIAFSMVFTVFAMLNIARPASAQELPDMKFGGRIYACNNSNPLENDPLWRDSTGFAIWINNSTSIPPFYMWTRYPQTGWYVTDSGNYSAVIPEADLNVTWSNGAEYRVEINTAAWGYETKNATSNGTGSYVTSGGVLPNDGDPEFSWFGNESNNISYWTWRDSGGEIQADDWQLWDVIANCTVFLGLPDLIPYDAIPGGNNNITINSGNYAPSPSANISVDIATGQVIVIGTQPSNIGPVGANDFWFGYFDNATGSTLQAATPFAPVYITTLASAASYPIPISSNVKYYTQEGTYYIFLDVDYNDDVAEDNVLTPLVDEEANNTLIIEVNVFDLAPPPSPMLEVDHETDDITIKWTNVSNEEIVSYNLYWAESPDEIDFSTPSANVKASGTALAYIQDGGVTEAKELYYAVRSVDVRGWEGPSSDIVAKCTIEIPQGYSTFSLPLEPFETKNASWYLDDMNMDPADVIFSYHASQQRWIPHPRFLPQGISDFDLVMGETYMVYSRIGKPQYTFVGRPGTTIRYSSGVDNPGTNLDDLRIGSIGDFNTSLSAIGEGDDIVIRWGWGDTWNVSAYESLGGFNIYRTTSRGGFDFTTPHAQIGFARAWRDTNATDDEYYYMVVPVNIYGREGSSTFAIGIKRITYGEKYNDFALYLKPLEPKALSGYLDDFGLSYEEIMATIFYSGSSQQTQAPHPAFIPAGISDPDVALSDGNLIYLIRNKEYMFVGW